MAKKGYTPEQIINKLHEAEILLNQGATIAVVGKKIGVGDHAHYRWRKEYGGMKVDQARRLRKLEAFLEAFKTSDTEKAITELNDLNRASRIPTKSLAALIFDFALSTKNHVLQQSLIEMYVVSKCTVIPGIDTADYGTLNNALDAVGKSVISEQQHDLSVIFSKAACNRRQMVYPSFSA